MSLSLVRCVFFFIVYINLSSALYEKKYPDAGLYLDQYNCQLDSMITAENFYNYTSQIEDIWSATCAANRGIFVLDPTDGQTYNCGKLPPDWGVTTVGEIVTAPPEVGMNALNLFIQSVYNTSSYEEEACADFNALSEFVCGREYPWKTAPWYPKLNAPIRGVNIGGLFVLERWILPNFTDWGNVTGIVDQYTFSEKCGELGTCDDLLQHWETFYSQDDFDSMRALGLNSVRLPVGHWYFEELSGFPSTPYIIPPMSILADDHPITKVIRYAKNAGIQVILDMHTAPGSQNGFDNSGQATNMTQCDNWGETWIYNPTNVDGSVAISGALAEYVNYIESMFNLDNVMAIEVLNEPWEDISLSLIKDFYVRAIYKIRSIRPDIPIILHDSFRGQDWGTELKDWPFEDVFLDTHAYECFNLDDLASDSPMGDRLKQYAHENEACAYKIPLHYETCNALPVVVGEFSIAIDDCMPYLNAQHQNYGQCNNIEMRINSSWWDAHVQSYAMRQIVTFERELGWTFWAWKLSPKAEEYLPSAWYWSFHLAAEKGYINMTGLEEGINYCLFGPDSITGNVDDVSGTDDITLEYNAVYEYDKTNTSSPTSNPTVPAGTDMEETFTFSALFGSQSRHVNISVESLFVTAVFSFLIGALCTACVLNSQHFYRSSFYNHPDSTVFSDDKKKRYSSLEMNELTHL